MLHIQIDAIDSKVVVNSLNLKKYKDALRLISIGNNEFLAISITNKKIFSIININDSSQYRFGDFFIESGSTVNNSFDIFQGSIEALNNNESFVYSSFSTPYLCLYSKENGFYVKQWECFLENPKYTYSGSEIKFLDTNIKGFSDFTIVDDKIYILHAKVMKKDSYGRDNIKAIPSLLYEFDMEGNPICKYNLDKRLLRISSDNDGNIYGVAYDEGFFRLVKLNI